MPEFNLKKSYYRDFFVEALPTALLIGGVIGFIGILGVAMAVAFSSITGPLLLLTVFAMAIGTIIAIAALTVLGAAIATLAKYAYDKIKEPEPFPYNEKAQFDSTYVQVKQIEEKEPNQSVQTINNDSTFTKIIKNSFIGKFIDKIFDCIDSKTVKDAQKKHNDYVNKNL